MSILIQQYSTRESGIEALGEALDEINIFDSVSKTSDSVSCIKNGVTLFNLTATAGSPKPSYTWKNISNATIASGYSTSNLVYSSVSICGKSVMFTYIGNSTIMFDYVFGSTKDGSVYMGFSYNHSSSLSDGQFVSLCENTSTLQADGFRSSTNPLWSRFVPICVQSNAHTVEETSGIFGFVEKCSTIPVTTNINIAPKRFSVNGIEYITDGGFILADM